MKKSILTLVLSLGGLTLSSCNFSPVRPLPSSSDVGPSSTSDVPSTSSSEPTSSASSTSGKSTSKTSSTSIAPTPVGKKKLSYTYDDYIDNNVYSLSNCPNSGNSKVLIIPIWFSDSSTYISTSNKSRIRSDIEKAYLGSESDTGWESVKTYYDELSGGKLKLNGTVSDWYSYSKASNNCTGDDTTALAKTASDWYFTNNPSDSRTNYDTDKDGYLDAVILIYGAPDYSTGAYGNPEHISDSDPESNLWAYCYWIQDTSKKKTSSPGANVYFWASYDFLYSNGNDAKSATGKTTYGSGDTSNCAIDAHTFIHEMGHVLGDEDYYDYSGQCSPAGGFSMQDCNVGSHDPYTAMAFGWVEPYVPTASTVIELKPFQSDHEVIVLSDHNDTLNSPFDEYLIIELYTPTGLNKFDCDNQYVGGYPQGPNTVGIRLWHVDGRLVKHNGSTYSSTPYTNPTTGNITHMMSNTYYKSGYEGYVSPLGKSYADYNLLQLIRKDGDTYKPSYDASLEATDLFGKNDTFTMSSCGAQFKNTGKLNTNKALGWSFTVDSCSNSGATITLVKA